MSNFTRIALLFAFLVSSVGAANVNFEPKLLNGDGLGYESTIVVQIRPKLWQYLSNHNMMTTEGALAVKILAMLPCYDQTLTAAFGPKQDKLSLDIIFGLHGILTPELKVNMNLEELTSQDYIQNILIALHPGMIGFEGAPGERITFASLASDMVRVNAEIGRTLPMEKATQLVAQWTARDGVLLYYRFHPETRLTGMEETPVYLLAIALQQSEPESPLFQDLTRLRSELGLSKVIVEMRKNQLPQSAIVIGAGHENDYREIVQKLPVTAKSYQAVPATKVTASRE